MKTKLLKITRALVLLILPLIVSVSGRATELSGKVIEVVDGNTISLKSLSHTISVRLLAVAPPEKNQPYGDVARQHLTDLILGKYVEVRYTGIGERGYLVGRVLLEQADINAQMLRDGAAWYQPAEGDDLSEPDRRLYLACESAARTERRGLWQQQSPIAPWAFRQSQIPAPQVTKTAPKATLQPEVHVPRSQGSSLSSEDILGGALTPGTMAGKPEFRKVSAQSAGGPWLRFSAPDQHFSASVPSDAIEVTYPVLDTDGKLQQMSYVFGTIQGTVCVLGSYKVVAAEGNDADVIDALVKDLVAAINRPLEKAGSDYKVTAGFIKNMQLNGYTGKQYRFSSISLPGLIRVYTKRFNNYREFLLLMALNNEGPESDQFLSSLKLAPALQSKTN